MAVRLKQARVSRSMMEKYDESGHPLKWILRTKIRLFKNGSMVHDQSFVSSSPTPLVGQDWLFGLGNLAYSIDETRLSSSARSSAWFKASYDNQKPTPDFPSTVGVVGDPSFTSTSSFTIYAEQPFLTLPPPPLHSEQSFGLRGFGLPPGLILDPSDGICPEPLFDCR